MMEPTKFTVGGHEYLIGRLDLFQSLNLSRLTGPILPVIFHEVLSKVALEVLNSKDEKEATTDDRIEAVGKLIYLSAPALQAIAKMPEKDFKTVISTCLSCAERHNGKTWTRVLVEGQPAFADITQQEALTIVFHVLARELRPTIAALGLFGSAAADSGRELNSGNSPTGSTT